jgi:hypothetical protein
LLGFEVTELGGDTLVLGVESRILLLESFEIGSIAIKGFAEATGTSSF